MPTRPKVTPETRIEKGKKSNLDEKQGNFSTVSELQFLNSYIFEEIAVEYFYLVNSGYTAMMSMHFSI